MRRLHTIAENRRLAALTLPVALTENLSTYNSSVPSSPRESAVWTPFSYGANSNLCFSKVLETDDGAPMDNMVAFDRQILTQSLGQIDANVSLEVFGRETSGQAETVAGGNHQGAHLSRPAPSAPRPDYLQTFPAASDRSNNESPVVATAAVSPLTPPASNFGEIEAPGNHVLNPHTPDDLGNEYTFL